MGDYLIAFLLWSFVGWLLIYVFRVGSVTISLTLYSATDYKWIAGITAVLAVLLWPIAPAVTFLGGFCIQHLMNRKKKR
ncbi:hypothetical protein [Ralstonia phage RP31]|uniref:Transmembrane protein n=1 Tax=Ralstonia phage RP31 TaxID=1923890 RepID=A0A1L7N269_9CAUD|nr:hypothetical protein [Ralstonia phage RP31]